MVATGLGIVCTLSYLFRTPLATFFLHEYLASQGVRSRILVDLIDFGGATAHGSLGRPRAPEVSFERIVVKFDPRGWFPKAVEIDVQGPIVRLTVGPNGISLGSLQPWIDARRAQSAGNTGYPSFVSDALAVNVVHARLIAATPAGSMEIDGNARIEGGKPRLIDAVVRSARLRSGIFSADVESGTLKGVATPSGVRLHASISGGLEADESGGPVHVDGARLSFDVPALRWKILSDEAAVSAASATLSFDADAASRQGLPPAPLSLRARFLNVEIGIAQGHPRSRGEVEATAEGSLSHADANSLVAGIPLLGGDRRAADALAAAVRDLALNVRLFWRVSHQQTEFTFAGPAQLSGAGPVLLRLSPVPGRAAVRFGPSGVAGGIGIDLSGRGVPNVAFAIPAFSWRRAGGAFDGVLGLAARFDLGAFQGVTVDGQADARLRNGVFLLNPERCIVARLASLTSRRKRVVSDASATFCAVSGQPFFSASNAGWTLRGTASELSANFDVAGLRVSRGRGRVVIDGSSAGTRDAKIDVAAVLSDRAKVARLAPESIAGNIQFANATVRGRFDVASGSHRTHIGTIDFTHRTKTGTGYARIDFPDVAFDTKGLQPVNISPLFSALARAEGSARFAGRLDWTAKRIDSGGRLDIGDLRFTSPLGVAEQLRTHMIFTSLLPPATAPGQPIDIARVDWALPLTRVETSVSFVSSLVRVAAAKTQLAGGTISLAPLSVELKPGMTVTSAVRLSHVSLGDLIAASNLGGRMRLDGRISGTIPFSFGPAGLRFTGGRIGADGPGRLSLDPGLWGSNEPNAVEKVAYQALENLAYDSLSATVDSEPHGRLRIVFHVKGYSDSPGTDEARVGLFDLLQGTAFQKNIPLPRGTPIDLSLDTSLNFDELLRGYESAWSQLTAEAR
ncbi:MAG: YdbH domain-containing protein [Alphaproteobacteria bacterium]|nr:YdbH domain-containing protein [Alphaproteobacteria bacterium]